MAGQHGGHRPGAGRPRGMTTKFAEEARALASPYAKKALKRAAELAGLVKDVKAAEAESVQAQCIAIILDRAYGRPKQPVEAPADGAALLPVLGPSGA